jgi:hypothetical protein
MREIEKAASHAKILKTQAARANRAGLGSDRLPKPVIIVPRPWGPDPRLETRPPVRLTSLGSPGWQSCHTRHRSSDTEYAVTLPRPRALRRELENGQLLAKRQVLRGDSGTVAEQRAQGKGGRAHDVHHGTSVRGT